MKTTWPILLSLLLLAAPAAVQAQDAYSTNADGSIYTYSTNADGSANIVAYAGPPWVVTIPAIINGTNVTSIGTNAFEFSSLTSVTIPSSVTSIGVRAFAECTSLTNATIESGVTSIGDDAFDSCYGLTSVTIPNSVTSIGEAAFYECTGLTSVTIGNSVTNIGTYAFEFCTSLTAITVDTSNPAYSSLNGVLFDKSQATLIEYPDGLGGSYTIPNSATSIGAYAFDSTSLTRVTIGTNVTSIGEDAFLFGTSLTNVTISASVTSIGTAAFESCSSLTNVTIPDSVTSIGDSAFEDDGLTSVTIPNSVTSIGTRAFEYCHSMTAITVDTNNPAFSSLNGVLFDKSQTTLIEYPGGSVGSYTIPNSVTSIGARAFEYCYFLTNVTIPNSVTSIGDDAFFYCADLTSVTIPNSVTSIGGAAFVDCTRLTSVTIGNSVTNIGNYAFYGCTSLTRVYFTGNAPSPSNVFRTEPATVYYLRGTTGWGAMFDGLPTALWFLPNPQILIHSAGFGVQPGGFGFTISWATNASVVVEAATNLANPVWIPLSTSPLTNGTSYFSDPQWTNYPERFYRAASAFTVGGTLTGLPAGDTVTLRDNGSDNLTLSNNGTFTFPTALPNGHAYSVTVSGTSGGKPTTATVTVNGSGNISGANVTNVAVQCSSAPNCPALTGDMDLDMYNAAVSDGTDNGGVPAVMFTTLGGPFRVTAIGTCSQNVCQTYDHWCWFDHTVRSNSCSSTTFPSGTRVIAFGSVVTCGGVSYQY